MKWLTGYEGQKHQARTGRDMPSFVRVANSPDFLDPANPPEHDRVFLDVAKYARPLEVDANTGTVNELITNEIMQIFTAHKDVRRAMRSLASTINRIQQRGAK
jgi:hypothetical protein